MSVTTSLAEHAVSFCQIVKHIPEELHRKYRLPMLARFCSGDLQNDILYVATVEEALPLAAQNPDCHFVCTENGLSMPDYPDSFCVVADHSAPEELFCIFQKLFADIESWRNRMTDVILSGKSFQQILDIAEEQIDADIVVMDSAFSAIAYTSDAQNSPDPIMHDLLQKGAHSLEKLEKFRTHGLFEAYEKTKGILVNEHGIYSKNATAGYWCRISDQPVIGIVMVCHSEYLPAFQKDLFETVVSMIEWCFRLQYRFGRIGGQPYESLFQELLSEIALSSEIVGERAQRIDLPFSGNFKLYLLTPVETNNFLAERVRRYLSDVLPEAKVITRGSDVALMYNFQSEVAADSNTFLEDHLLPCLTQFNLYCGISRLFLSLMDLKTAYDQAACAIFYGRWLKQVSQKKKSYSLVNDLLGRPHMPNVFFYENAALYQMIDSGLHENKELFRLNPYIRALKRLKTHDLQKGTSYYLTLFIYLSLERRPTESSRALNIHRTNLQYHLEKIQDIISLSLDDANIRLNFLIAYRAMELMEE